MTEPSNSKVPKIRFKGFEGEWDTCRLDEAATVERGKFSARPRNDPKYFGGIIPFVQTGDVVSANRRLLRYFQTLNEEGLAVSRSFPKNTILITIAANIGDLAITDFSVACPDSVVTINAHDDFDTDFLHDFLSTKKGELEAAATTAAQANINLKVLKPLVLVAPTLQEQTHIGGYFREVDRLIGLQQRKHDKMVTLKKAMLQKLFPQPGATTPEIRFKGFPEEWDERLLSKLTSKVTEKNILKEHSETFTNSAEFGIISQRNYFDKDISNAENIGGYYIVEPDNFVYNPRISALAPVGPINRNKLGRTGVMSPLYTVFRTKDIDNTFLEYFLKTSLWHSFMFFNGDTGARADRFSIKDAVFMELPVPYPVLLEQQKIGRYFRTLDELISQHALQIQKLKQLKSACLEKMFV